MRAVIQRVKRAKVTVNGETTGEIGTGLLVLLGVGRGDDEVAAEYLASKTVGLRVFEDGDGKMNLVGDGSGRRGAGGVAVHALRGRAEGEAAVI